ncbi:hypothetical protein [Nitratireductor aquibiodomus]|uniref:hypothetical protein n=1 Tax=Nitratireductor aquibiodomus TaxID=204799 RepID=UPI000A69C7D6|nr:hypothetical protein [Nitratireductor aquibiodomus]
MTHSVNPDSFGFLVADIHRLIRGTMDRAIADAGLGVTPGEARTWCMRRALEPSGKMSWPNAWAWRP